MTQQEFQPRYLTSPSVSRKILDGLAKAVLGFILLTVGYNKAPVQTGSLPGAVSFPEIEMVFVEGGTFMMGCPSEQGKECWFNEKPAHRVTLGSFYIGKYEVTQAQWKAVMGNNPSTSKGDNLPVENVSGSYEYRGSNTVGAIAWYQDAKRWRLSHRAPARDAPNDATTALSGVAAT